jgi:hypothetical protein
VNGPSRRRAKEDGEEREADIRQWASDAERDVLADKARDSYIHPRAADVIIY